MEFMASGMIMFVGAISGESRSSRDISCVVWSLVGFGGSFSKFLAMFLGDGLPPFFPGMAAAFLGDLDGSLDVLVVLG